MSEEEKDISPESNQAESDKSAKIKEKLKNMGVMQDDSAPVKQHKKSFIADKWPVPVLIVLAIVVWWWYSNSIQTSPQTASLQPTPVGPYSVNPYSYPGDPTAMPEQQSASRSMDPWSRPDPLQQNPFRERGRFGPPPGWTPYGPPPFDPYGPNVESTQQSDQNEMATPDSNPGTGTGRFGPDRFAAEPPWHRPDFDRYGPPADWGPYRAPPPPPPGYSRYYYGPRSYGPPPGWNPYMGPPPGYYGPTPVEKPSE